MRLVKLAANKATFRTVEFNRAGTSLVLARQDKPRSNKTGTYNGVGKSLMLELVHYCLGASANKGFETHLKEWVFHLTVEIDGKDHVISRSADRAKQITLDEQEIALDRLRAYLAETCFELDPNIPRVTFRSLIGRFIRSGRDAYTSFSLADAAEHKDPYGAMLRNAFLLGLDLHLAKKKYELRKREQKLRETMKQLENEPLFADLLGEDKVDIELMALQEQADKLRSDVETFRVAEDYHAIEQEANEIKRGLGLLRRESVKIGEGILQIERSLQTRSDLPKERVFQLYAEAGKALPEQIQRRVEEVLRFQHELQQRRIFRLTREREELERQRRGLEEQIRSASQNLDAKLRYLNEHRALDEYVAVTNELSELQQRIAKLKESKALRDRVDRELRRIERDHADQNIQTDDYLTSAKELIAEAVSTFRAFAKELYGTRPSGLSIKSDDGDNQQRYRIDAHIKADVSEGINEAKIFCYDMTLLTLRRGHSVDFLVHDSTLFGPVDPRQRLTMFRIADRVCRDRGLQYISTLNMHDIAPMREQTGVDAAEFDRLFGKDRTVLTLTDQSARDKLLGIDIDMKYME